VVVSPRPSSLLRLRGAGDASRNSFANLLDMASERGIAACILALM
jgi:hypothetical protein